MTPTLIPDTVAAAPRANDGVTTLIDMGCLSLMRAARQDDREDRLDVLGDDGAKFLVRAGERDGPRGRGELVYQPAEHIVARDVLADPVGDPLVSEGDDKYGGGDGARERSRASHGDKVRP